MIAFLLGVTLSTQGASAAPAPAKYRIITIHGLGLAPPVATNGPKNSFGINSKGEVCGTFLVSEHWHAFVWLPFAGYSMTAGFHDIHDEADLGESSDSVANDINEDGLVAGVSGGVGPSTFYGTAGVATLWTLGDPVEAETLDFLDGGEWSVAYGINDDGSTPTIVGTSESAEPFCAEIDTVHAPFRLVYNSGSITPLPPNEDTGHHFDSDAFDVNNTGDVQIVGTTLLLGLSCTLPEATCISERDAALWVVSSGTATFSTLPPLASSSFHREEIARGNNDTGEIVGMAQTGTGGTDCEERAAIWEGSSHVLTNLGALLSSAQKFSIAEAVNGRDEDDRLQVVGLNKSANTAARWPKDPDAQTEWVASHMIDLICLPCSEAWSALVEAHDINDNGWIIGWGIKNSEVTAFLLIPLDECEDFTCTGDLNGIDGVNSTDLGILLSSWSDPDSLALGCAGANSCPSDLNCDGAVNSLDLGILLAAWGRCPGQSMMSSEGPSLDDLIVIFCDLGHEDMIAILVEVWESMH